MRLLYYAKRAETASLEALHDTWTQAHTELLHQHPAWFAAVLNCTVPAPGGAAPYDLMYELGFVGPQDVPTLQQLLAGLEERVAAVTDKDSGRWAWSVTRETRRIQVSDIPTCAERSPRVRWFPRVPQSCSAAIANS